MWPKFRGIDDDPPVGVGGGQALQQPLPFRPSTSYRWPRVAQLVPLTGRVGEHVVEIACQGFKIITYPTLLN
jgi:hypothetical protein